MNANWPEWQLLLACVGLTGETDEVRRRVDALRHPARVWERLAKWASDQGLAPLLWYNLRRLGVMHSLPPSVQEILSRAYYTAAARTALLYQELHDILHTLQARGSTIIVLKGAALAETVYPSRVLRPMHDVDLLVREENLPGIECALEALGYRLNTHPKSKAWFTAHHYHWRFVKQEGTVKVMHCEVHWGLHRPHQAFAIEVERLWERARPATIAQVETQVLSPEDTLLYLCFHLCKHRLTFGALRGLCDIAATIRHYQDEIAWGHVQARAEHWRIAPSIYLCLRLAKELVGAAVPQDALASLVPTNFDEHLLEWATARILPDLNLVALPPQLDLVQHAPRLTDLSLAIRGAFSGTVLAQRYGVLPTAKQRYYYYPRRLVELVTRYGPVWWGQVWRKQELRARAAGQARLDAWLAPLTGAAWAPDRERQR